MKSSRVFSVFGSGLTRDIEGAALIKSLFFSNDSMDRNEPIPDGKHEDSRYSLKDDSGGVEMIDPKGDLVLVVGQYQLLVCSRILELSCSFFKTMLRSNSFLEGDEQPNADLPPAKQLHDDHPDIFRLVCRILHYRQVHPPDSINDYGHLAEVADFYGCGWALSPQVRTWMESWTLSKLSTRELQILLRVSFVFHLRIHFLHVSLQLAEALTVRKWKEWEVHPMPQSLKGEPLKRRKPGP